MTAPQGDPAPTDPQAVTEPPTAEPPKEQEQPPTEQGTPNPRVAELETKYSQAAADLAEAQRKLTELERKGMDEQERTKAERDELAQKFDEATKALQDRSIENAFLMNNDQKWHNPATALRLLDRSNLKVADDGSVTGIKEAIQALSKSDPYLLADSGSGNGNNAKTPPTGSTGNNPGTNGGGNDAGAQDRKKLEKKYPAIRR